ncbi:hypothetical protein DL768_007525 [Monosporascus sp. mg162]|nr:hypothetical protein DL768_007525 [Monosporascus sp. mg162]
MATPMAPPLTPSQIASIDEDRGPTVTIVTSTLIALSTSSVFLRFVARTSRQMKYGLDDWLSIGALLFHMIGYFNALIYIAVHWFIKMSILAFYRRVFTLNIAWFKYAVYGTAVYTSGCLPPAYFWEQYDPSLNPPPEGSCGVNNPALVISSAALNTVGDVVVFALPLAMLWQLNLRQSHKIALIALFTTGAFRHHTFNSIIIRY